MILRLRWVNLLPCSLLAVRSSYILIFQGSVSGKQDIMLARLPKPPAKQAPVPKGTPIRKSWYVKRRHVMEKVCEALTGDEGPHLVGLVGDSGAGKTTAAAEIVSCPEVREAFSDGIVWLAVNEGAKRRLPSLMLQLARMVYQDIEGSAGRYPAATDDGVECVKRCMQRGHGGKGLRCLVVADNVWEEEVVSKLLRTGMSVLVSTRNEELVTEPGEAVRVNQLARRRSRPH